MKKINFIIFFLLFAVNYSFAQIQFKGEVIDSNNLKALSETEVFISPGNISFKTNAKGAFESPLLETGSYTINFFKSEYKSKVISINLSRDTSIIVRMERLAATGSEIIIKDKTENIFETERLKSVEGTSIFAGRKTEVVQLEKVNGNKAANNARQIYSKISGLNIYEGNTGGLQLGIGGRGLDPKRTESFNVRQNGYDISADVLGYPESYYTPPSELIDKVQVVRGAASLQYGTQFGGLLNFVLKDNDTDKKFGGFTRNTIGSFGFLNTSNALKGKINKFEYFTFFNFKRGNGYSNNSDFNSYNLFSSLTFNFHRDHNFNIQYTNFDYLAKQAGGLTDQQFLEDPRQSTRDRNWFDVNWQLLNLKFNGNVGKQNKYSLNIFGLNALRNSVGFRGNPSVLNQNPVTALDEQDQDGNYILPRDLIKGTFKNYGAEFRWITKYQIKEQNAVFLTGLKWYDARNTSLQGPGSLGEDADFNFYTDDFPDYSNQSDFIFPNKNLAWFAEHIFNINAQLSITPGLRWEYIDTKSEGKYNEVIFDIAGNPIANNSLQDNRQLKRNFLLAGVGINYIPLENTVAYLNVSQNYRSVTFSDIRVVNPSFIIDENISDETGFTGDIGIRSTIKNSVLVELNGFGILYDNRIGIILDNRANRVRKNIGTALIYGIENLVDARLYQQKIRKLDFLINAFYNIALTSSSYIDSEEQNVSGNEVEFVPLINLKSGLKLAYGKASLNYQISYLSEQFSDAQNSPTPIFGDIKSGIIGLIPSYAVSDLTLAWKPSKFELEAGINNLFDQQYYTRRATGYPGPGIIPSDGRSFFLSLGLQF